MVSVLQDFKYNPKIVSNVMLVTVCKLQRCFIVSKLIVNSECVKMFP